MNLSQAEAIRDLIDARTSAAALQATRQLKGELSTALQPCKDQLLAAIVQLESALEFVEDDLPQIQLDKIKKGIGDVLDQIKALVSTYATGHLLRDGLKVTLIGRPNVGKSSVFNKLLRFERAIVTDLAGTTRDSLTESISLGGIPVQLTDTAGIRKAGDRIEEIGVERTQRAIAESDLLVVVLDGSAALASEDRDVLDQAANARHVIAINKSDLPSEFHFEDQVQTTSKMIHLSALTGEGVEDLIAGLLEPFGGVDSDNAGLLITDSRHYDLLRRTQTSLEESLGLIDENAGEELVLVGLHNALRFLGEITGETTTEEILSEIFSTFCIGK